VTTFLLKDENRGTEREFESKSEAEDTKQDLLGLGASESDLEITAKTGNPPDEATHTTDDGHNVQQGGKTDGGRVEPVEKVDEPVDAESVTPESLSKNPIGFLESVNSDFVNTIKGTPAISKQGFRFIQREFEISTESEVVEWSEDPLGCVVWAKAELSSGYSAEAHGEGYQFEGDVSDNEFVRYADTRAKNRAISDLTSAGALAVSELTNE